MEQYFTVSKNQEKIMSTFENKKDQAWENWKRENNYEASLREVEMESTEECQEANYEGSSPVDGAIERFQEESWNRFEFEYKNQMI
jgi:hypothetical protein